MRSRPEDLTESDLVASVAKTWGLDLVDAVYFAEGGGSYHWVVTTADGIRHFVTVDDLDEKRFLGDTREGTFTALRSAFDTASALRTNGLDYVVAPRRSPGGETVHRIGARYSVALFPFIEGTPGSFGVVLRPEERTASSICSPACMRPRRWWWASRAT